MLCFALLCFTLLRFAMLRRSQKMSPAALPFPAAGLFFTKFHSYKTASRKLVTYTKSSGQLIQYSQIDILKDGSPTNTGRSLIPQRKNASCSAPISSCRSVFHKISFLQNSIKKISNIHKKLGTANSI